MIRLKVLMHWYTYQNYKINALAPGLSSVFVLFDQYLNAGMRQDAMHNYIVFVKKMNPLICVNNGKDIVDCKYAFHLRLTF